MTAPNSVEGLLRELLVEIRGMRGDLRRLTPVPIAESDEELIAAIQLVFADRVFTSADLMGASGMFERVRLAIEA
jgi:hypothetical protein